MCSTIQYVTLVHACSSVNPKASSFESAYNVVGGKGSVCVCGIVVGVFFFFGGGCMCCVCVRGVCVVWCGCVVYVFVCVSVWYVCVMCVCVCVVYVYVCACVWNVVVCPSVWLCWSVGVSHLSLPPMVFVRACVFMSGTAPEGKSVCVSEG